MHRDKILILMVPHGAAHERLANALRKPLRDLHPALTVEVVNALEHCAGWFQLYYDSYQFPLKYWPALWGWIEGLQHAHQSTGPRWFYRRGAQPLFGFLRSFDPGLVIATEVGICELAAMFKRETQARFPLVAAPTGVDLDRAWVQPEVSLYTVDPRHSAQALESWGVAREHILACGVPTDPVFASLPDRVTARRRLGVPAGGPLVLILFGGTGVAVRPSRLIPGLRNIREPSHFVAIAGRNASLRRRLERYRERQPNLRVLGWVDNIHLWMAAANLLIGQPGGNTVFEAINCGLPLLVHDPLPGSQVRTCALIEQWQVGHWIKRSEEIPAVIQSLWRHPHELQKLRNNALAMRHPGAARVAAQAILNLLPNWDG
jgi:processive 1,2-diacylglycerol beta-glucosyltransferase